MRAELQLTRLNFHTQIQKVGDGLYSERSGARKVHI